jgi:CubicO group peptidase (beta-lactamase class C family)
MSDLEPQLDAIAAEAGLSGVVRVDRADGLEVAKSYGLANRTYGIPNTVDTQFALASGTKGFTALAVVGLIEDGLLELATPVRSVLGRDLQLVGDDVTIEHLLSHRSGIGDYLDEEVLSDANAYGCRCPCTSLPRARTTSRCSTGIRPSSLRASASPTATAATSSSRSWPSA